MAGNPKIAFVGFGEASGAFAEGWRDALQTESAPSLRAYDLKLERGDLAGAMRERMASFGVQPCPDGAAALSGAEAVFCLVTADQAAVAAEAAAQGGALGPGTLWFDGNSCAPSTKRRAGEIIGAAGGRYVDMAIMAPVYPKRHHVPVNLSGPDAEAGAGILKRLDMAPKVVGAEIGDASTLKMLRSVMIKGMEALMAECLLSARRAGVEEAILASLERSDPDVDWRGRGTYAMDRMMVHGVRRGAELEEVARTVADLGLGGGMSAATALWEARIGALGLDPGAEDLGERFDRVLAGLGDLRD